MPNGTEFLNTLLNRFNQIFASGTATLGGKALSLFATLLVIEITLFALFWALTGSDVAGKFLKKILVIGFFKYVLDHYSELISSIRLGFTDIGTQAAGSSISAMENPSEVVNQGVNLVVTVLKFVASQGQISFFNLGAIVDSLVLVLIVLAIFVTYLILALQIVLCRIEFGLVTTLGIVLVPFGVFRHTAFITEKLFGAIISFGVKLMVLSFVVSIGMPLISSYTLPQDPSWFELLQLVPPTAAIAALAIHAPAVVAGLLSGAPSLSAGAVMAPASIGATIGAAGAGVAGFAGSKVAGAVRGAAASLRGNSGEGATQGTIQNVASSVTSSTNLVNSSTNSASSTSVSAGSSNAQERKEALAAVFSKASGDGTEGSTSVRQATANGGARGGQSSPLRSISGGLDSKKESENSTERQAPSEQGASKHSSLRSQIEKTASQILPSGQGPQGSLVVPLKVHEEI